MVGALSAEQVPRKVYRAVLLILRPAESAVRRLIVIAAHGLTVKPASPRAFLGHLKRTAGRGRSAQFQLFDTRKRFRFNRPRYFKPGAGPRITFFPVDDDPRVPLFRPPVDAVTIEVAPARELSVTVSAKSLCRRLTAIGAALEDIPRQARRYVRWQARRAAMKDTKFRDAFRPGPPPGSRKRLLHPVDDILRECQWLAHDHLKANTS